MPYIKVEGEGAADLEKMQETETQRVSWALRAAYLVKAE
jgi:hypothetical protein